MNGDAAHDGPLLDGRLADRAARSLDALSARLAAVDVEVIDDASWSSGTGGIAVAHAYLHERFPRRGHDESARRALERTVERASAGRVRPWLFEGLAGIGWAIEHIAGDEDDASDPNAAIGAKLARLVATAETLPWELMYGVAGCAAFALERLARPGARDLLLGIGKRLAASAERVDGGARWVSLPSWSPNVDHAAPYVSFGAGHGMPGALTALAAIVEARDAHEGGGDDELRRTVADASRWLLAQRLDDGEAAWFRVWSDDAGAPARTAWCYGDPGVAWALMVAARALGDASIERDAIAIATHAAARDERTTGVADAGLCHGAAGLAHLFHRMHMLHRDAPHLRDAARIWFARTLDRIERDGAALSHGLLDGAAGIALALVTALDERTTGWDRPLLLRGA